MEHTKYTAKPAENIYKSFIRGAPDLKSRAPQSSTTDPTKFLPFEIKQMFRFESVCKREDEPDWVRYEISAAFTSVSPTVQDELRETFSMKESEKILKRRAQHVCIEFRPALTEMACGLTVFLREYERSLGPNDATAPLFLRDFAKIEWPTTALDQWTKAFSDKYDVEWETIKFRLVDRHRLETEVEINSGRTLRVEYQWEDHQLSSLGKLGLPDFTLSISPSAEDGITETSVIVALKPTPQRETETVRDLLINSIATAVNSSPIRALNLVKEHTIRYLELGDHDEHKIEKLSKDLFEVTSSELSRPITIELLRTELHSNPSLTVL